MRFLFFALIISSLSLIQCGKDSSSDDSGKTTGGTATGGSTATGSSATGGTATGGDFGDCKDENTFNCGANNEGLICKNKKYQKLFVCGDGEKCTPYKSNLSCGEYYIAVEDTPCENEGNAMCTQTKDKMLKCQNKVWVQSRNCAPSKCVYKKEAEDKVSVSCENNGISVGDECDFPEGSGMCSTDGKAILICKEKKAVVGTDCGEKKCQKVGEDKIGCQ